MTECNKPVRRTAEGQKKTKLQDKGHWYQLIHKKVECEKKEWNTFCGDRVITGLTSSRPLSYIMIHIMNDSDVDPFIILDYDNSKNISK